MKHLKSTIAYISFSAIMLLFNACGNKSNNSNPPTFKNSNGTSISQDEHFNEDANIDGVYSGSQSISGVELVAKLTISGSRWSASSQLGYDSPEIQNGIVKGNDLYDDSGMIKIGYVTGNSASINGYPSMSK